MDEETTLNISIKTESNRNEYLYGDRLSIQNGRRISFFIERVDRRFVQAEAQRFSHGPNS